MAAESLAVRRADTRRSDRHVDGQTHGAGIVRDVRRTDTSSMDRLLAGGVWRERYHDVVVAPYLRAPCVGNNSQ